MEVFRAWLAALGEWLTALGEQYPWLEPASAILGIIGAAAAVVLSLRNRIIGKAYRIRREVEEKNERLKADVAALRSETALVKARLPETAWAVAERERRDDNEESAIRALRRHMDTEGARLSEMARQIARFHLGLVAGQERDRHLVPAERFALLAFHLDPRNAEAGALLKEVQQLRGGQPFEHVQFTDALAENESDGDYGFPQSPEAVVSLLDDADTAIRRGDYRHAYALAEVACLSARRWTLGDREPLAMSARDRRARALLLLGGYDQALAEIDGADQRPGVLRLREQSQDFGPTHPETLSTRGLRADILRRLGHYDQALAEIDGTDQHPGILRLEQRSPDLGPTHPATLGTRHLRADILKNLGRYDQALAEIDGTDQRPGILRLEEQSPDLGPTHPPALSTRHLRADILKVLGRYDQALAEIDGTDQRPGVLRLREQNPGLGPTHPASFGSRSLRGAILCDLGHHEDSERELRSVGAGQEAALGPAHSGTLRTGHRLATTLAALGRLGDAEELLRAVVAARRDRLGDASGYSGGGRRPRVPPPEAVRGLNRSSASDPASFARSPTASRRFDPRSRLVSLMGFF